MIVTEVAQLVHGSSELQQVVRDLKIKPGADVPPDKARVLDFLRAMTREKNASRYLRRTLLQAIAQQKK